MVVTTVGTITIAIITQQLNYFSYDYCITATDKKIKTSLLLTVITITILLSPFNFLDLSSDILLSSRGQLKLGDFGLARTFDPNSNKSLSHQVVSVMNISYVSWL
jgi:serine/threonine protein kinase